MRARDLIRAGTAVLIVTGLVLASEGLRQSTPQDGSTVLERPRSVVLQFAEPIEPHRSSFFAYRLSPAPPNAAALKRAVADLTARMQSGKPQQTGRADVDVTIGERLATSLQVQLKTKLETGVYVVIWRVFTASEVFQSGYISFTYAP